MKQSVLLILLILSINAFTQNVINDRDNENINKEINSLKAANAKLKAQLTEYIAAQDKKIEVVNGSLNSSETKIKNNTDSLTSATLTLAGFQKYTLHKFARHKKVLSAYLLWMFIGFGVLTILLLILFIILKRNMHKEAKIMADRINEIKDIFSKELNSANEALDDKINNTKNLLNEQVDNTRKLLEKEMIQIEQTIEGKLKNINNGFDEHFHQINQTVENIVLNLNHNIENNFNNLHQLVNNNIGDVKKSFDVKVNELNANLSKHTHNPVKI